MRMYEEWGLIQIPDRKPNGYRVFTDIHLDQFLLVRKAFLIEVLQAGLRKKIIEAIKYSAQYRFEDAISSVKSYLQITQKEINNATEAGALVNELLLNKPDEGSVHLKRAEAAHELGLTIDTIRNWEMNGLLNIKRKDNGYRVYHSMDIKRLKIIRSLRCANYSLSAILRMLNTMDKRNDFDLLEVLNTPQDNEDIVTACDRLIDSLNAARQNAQQVLQLLINMKSKYQSNINAKY